MYRIKSIALVAAILFCCIQATKAQVMLEGLVTSKKNQPVPNASIQLSTLKDQTTVISVQSDSMGLFRINNILPGSYQLVATHTGFRKYSQQVLLQRDTFMHVYCPQLTDTLEEATVTGRKPLLERKIDRFVYNIGGTPFATGNTVWDALKQTPMVRMSEQSGISVLGNPKNAVIFINHRRFPLSGDDLINYLKDMPSDNIVRIEILSIPPANYDVTVPVIDIILKKTNINGIKGTVTTSYEQSRVGKTNVSLGLDMNKNNYNQTLFIDAGIGNTYQQIDKTSLFKNTANMANTASGITLNAQRKRINGFTDIRYSVSPIITMGTQWTVNAGKTDNRGLGDEVLYPAGNSSKFDQTINSFRNLVSGNGFIRYSSEKRKRTLELSGDFLSAETKQTNTFINTPNTGSIRTIVPQHITNYAAKLDYSAPLVKTINLEAGLRYSHSAINTPYEAYSYSGSDWLKLTPLSATFQYREGVTAGYASLENTFSEKWSAKLGLRLEHTDIQTRIEGAKPVNLSNGYTFVFPIGYLNFNPSPDHGFSLSSTTDNTRPEYSSLNPARILVGVRTVTEGNPFLNPSGGGAVELIYSLKQQYHFGLMYSTNKKLFTQQNDVLPPDTLLVKWQNWGNQRQYSVSFNTFKYFFKGRLGTLFYTWFNYNRRLLTEGQLLNSQYANNVQWQLTVNNSFSNILSKNLKLYLNASFASPQQFGLWRDDLSFRIDAGGIYHVKKWNTRFSLALNDIMKYNDRNKYTTNETFNQLTRVLSNYDSRSVRISISKTFGNQKTKKLQKRETANEEEKNRAK